MIYSQPWRTPSPIWNQSVVPCPVWTVASWPAYSFLKRQVRWSGIPISWRIFQFVVICSVFLKFFCFSYDPKDVKNLISGSSAFSKSSLNIWKFLVHVLLKPSLENFDHDVTNLWNECKFAVVWTNFGIALLWIGMNNDLLQLWPLLSLIGIYDVSSKC